MVIRLKHSRLIPLENEKSEKGYRLISLFIERFKHQNNSTLFKDLIGYDLSKPEEFEIIKEKNLTIKLYAKF